MFALPNAGSRVLYHIGKRPAQPVLRLSSIRPGEGWSYRKSGYVPAADEKVVFLTPSPAAVAYFHGIRGHVYAYEVPNRVIKALGGINVLDQAPEVIIPERLWPQVKFLGRSETDTVQFHRERASTRTPHARWNYGRFPREVREARFLLWQRAVQVLGLGKASPQAWLQGQEHLNAPFLWPADLTRYLLQVHPEACRRALEQAGQAGALAPLPQSAVARSTAVAQAIVKVPSKEDRLRLLLFPESFVKAVFRRLDRLFLTDSRYPGRKPPTRSP